MKRVFDKMFGRKPSAKPAGRQTPAPMAEAPQPAEVKPKFVPQNDLEQLLALAAADPAKRLEFQKMLLEEDLLAATPKPPEGEAVRRTVSSGETISLLNVPGPDGKPAAAVFTSQTRIVDAFGDGVGFIQMNGETLLGLVAEQGVILNPGAIYSVHWTPEQLKAVLGKPVSWTVKKDTKVFLGAPAETPEALVAELRAALTTEPRIQEAWLALAHWPEQDEFSWYLDVRTSLSREQVNEALGPAFKNLTLADRALNMIVNPAGSPAGTGIRVVPQQLN
jgi:hypothetical protein